MTDILLVSTHTTIKDQLNSEKLFNTGFVEQIPGIEPIRESQRPKEFSKPLNFSEGINQLNEYYIRLCLIEILN